MHPDARNGAPVAVEVAFVVAPQALGEADVGVAQHQLADLARADRLAAFIDYVNPGAEPPRAERAWPQGMVQGAGEVAAAHLGAADDVEERQFLFADVLEEPAPGRLGPGLAAGAGDAQRRQVVALDFFVAVAHQAADQRGRYT